LCCGKLRNGGNGYGGAIYVAGGSVTIKSSFSISDSHATGGAGGAGGRGGVGATSSMVWRQASQKST
jgi:hypothetical protein